MNLVLWLLGVIAIVYGIVSLLGGSIIVGVALVLLGILLCGGGHSVRTPRR